MFSTLKSTNKSILLGLNVLLVLAIATTVYNSQFLLKNNRIVHVVITTFKLKEFAKQIVEEGGNSFAIFELEPVKTV